jgi:NADH:flavin oxidoreductase/NADH oxidase family protein
VVRGRDRIQACYMARQVAGSLFCSCSSTATHLKSLSTDLSQVAVYTKHRHFLTDYYPQFQGSMTVSSIPKLFQPIRVGTANLQHRVVMAPMARFRADAQHVHGPLALEYYKQRTSVPGTLAITEGTIIAAQAGGYRKVPGIWSEEQISGWSKVRSSYLSPSLRRLRYDALSFLNDIYPPCPSSRLADCRRGAQKWLVHLPPAHGARAHRFPRRPTRRRVPARST